MRYSPAPEPSDGRSAGGAALYWIQRGLPPRDTLARAAPAPGGSESASFLRPAAERALKGMARGSEVTLIIIKHWYLMLFKISVALARVFLKKQDENPGPILVVQCKSMLNLDNFDLLAPYGVD